MTNEIELVNAYQDGSELVLLRRKNNGALQEERRRSTFDCFVKTRKLPDAMRMKLESSPHVASVSVEGKFTRIGWKSYEARNYVCSTYVDPNDGRRSPFFAAGIKVYEGDVAPLRRFLVDNKVKLQLPRRIYLDIETDSRKTFADAKAGKARLLCWTLVDEAETVVATGMLEEDDDEDEKRIHRELWKQLEAYDQVVAFSSREGDTFDFNVIKARARVLGVKHLDSRRWLWLDHLKAYLKMNLQVAESGDEKSSYKLQDVAMAQLGEGKDDFDASKTWEAWVAGGASRKRLLAYNTKDTILLPRIEKETGYLALIQSISEVCGILPDSRAVDALTQIDTYLLRLGKERGYRFNTARYSTDEERKEEEKHLKMRGAYVMQPNKKGIISGVHVCDFARLYPSIMITWNMSPETKVANASPNGPLEEGTCRTPSTGAVFKTSKEGLVPFFLKQIAAKRKFWTDLKASLSPGTPEWHDADRKSNAYKVLMNATYGVISSKFSRYYDIDIGEGITQTGVYLIKRVQVELEKRWPNCVIYIDTDSNMVWGPLSDEFREAVKWLNAEVFPKIATMCGCVVNDVKLEYEKEFARLFFVKAKRYAGKFAHYKGKVPEATSTPEIKGLEFKRGDQLQLTRRLQEKALRMILGEWSYPKRCASCKKKIVDVDPKKQQKTCPRCGVERKLNPPIENVEEYRKLIIAARDYILKAPLPREEVQLSQGLNKGLKGYIVKKKGDGQDAAQPPHVVVAKMLKERGAEVGEGTRIHYVVVDASKGIKAIPAEDFVMGETKFDRYYIWENKVWPPTQRVLEAAFPGSGWTEFDRVRPKYRRPKAGGAGEGQESLFDRPAVDRSTVVVSTPAPAGSNAVVAPQRRRRADAPYVVRGSTSELHGKLEKLKKLFLKYPGARPVVLRIVDVDASGAEVATTTLDIPLKVAGTPELAGRIERLIARTA